MYLFHLSCEFLVTSSGGSIHDEPWRVIRRLTILRGVLVSFRFYEFFFIFLFLSWLLFCLAQLLCFIQGVQNLELCTLYFGGVCVPEKIQYLLAFSFEFFVGILSVQTLNVFLHNRWFSSIFGSSINLYGYFERAKELLEIECDLSFAR